MPGLSSHSAISIFLAFTFWLASSGVAGASSGAASAMTLNAGHSVMPVAQDGSQPLDAASGSSVPRINVPYFDGDVRYSETGVFWFGHITPVDNYADIRVGYTDQELYVNVAVFDRRLWYQASPTRSSLTAWDAVSLYLRTAGNAGDRVDDQSYRFIGQLTGWENPRTNWQAVDRGSASGWTAATLPFATQSDWRGDAANTNGDDRGWAMTFRIPFASLGFSVPAPGTVWGVAVSMHDRDDANGTPIPVQSWPAGVALDRPGTWGQLSFGLPGYTPAPASPGGTVVVRHRLNGATVTDGQVGGDTSCGSGLDFWSDWGNANYAGLGRLNVQNQSDIADWPCFSKYYVTFPLQGVPPEKVVVSAKLTLYQFGNAGGGSYSDPSASYVQVLTAGQDWDERSLAWNNAPPAKENISGAWVDPLQSFPGWPGVARAWDVSRAVDQAYRAGEPLRLVLYSADDAYHSGRYFTSSDVEDWDAEGRPTLTIIWGEPLPLIQQTARPAAVPAGRAVNYTISVLGTGEALAVTDDLPPELSFSGRVETTGGAQATYDPALRRLSWSGAPGAGQHVTIVYTAVPHADRPLAIRNTATLSGAEGQRSSATATIVVNPREVWLPLARR